MTSERIERRLAAVLAADVVGYSRLMGADELGTFERIRAHRKELFEPAIARHRGRIFKLMGDGLLAEFASVVDAVSCAVELQRTMLQRNLGVPDERRIDVRIGINLGDVIVEDGDRHGDAINLAARLEQLARPNGICISNKVRTEISGKVDISFENGGEQRLKNIAQTITVFHWRPEGAAPLVATDAAGTGIRVGGPAGSGAKPSLALSRLGVLDGDSQAIHLAAGLNEAVASSLANLTGISLVTEANDANYHASGSVQTYGSRFRVTMKLLNHWSKKQFWSEHFDGDIATTFDTLDDLAFHICSALRYEVYEQETERTRLRSLEEQTNEELMGQASHILLNSRRSDYERSVTLIDLVVKRDPNNFMALAIRAWGAMVEVVCGYRDVSPADAKVALQLARKATELNGRSDFAHLVYGLNVLYLKRDLDAAARQARRSLELNPNYALAIDLLGMTTMYAGDAEGGLRECKRALEASPRFPANNWFMDNMAIGNFLRGDYLSAAEWARRSDEIHGDIPRCMLLLITSYAHAGRAAEAGGEAERLMQACPDFRIRDLRRWPFLREQDWARFTDGLMQARLPD
ncbi:adenylate/guanylate cyclase domain-containing protein [Mesorhizobium sp. BAC0120]|uniref:adenylate/guanylate cyclase domain-containing protein n=1 Tax=Mesorhizobium sp. BAC0120 TaxID=3090670 RepID=UPI00298C1E60|nr:adenylate/guanylate cyclase domain-containing protein [Mesorhizobium sp. BAC0120]MDW6025754.1 adenylate/guanylate cyclase domain-containing protein [Mesorhizobium sp. BAC0120]